MCMYVLSNVYNMLMKIYGIEKHKLQSFMSNEHSVYGYDILRKAYGLVIIKLYKVHDVCFCNGLPTFHN